MGLCKCPKRKVTNQFCYEHRVNVCEHCMVSKHPKCIVLSYLQWLQDSDYNPICELCSGLLSDGECIRLVCYHVYHWNCLDTYGSRFPSITASSGYTCPTCKTPIFPPSNLVSPVADILKGKLKATSWARTVDQLPELSEIEDKTKKPVDEVIPEQIVTVKEHTNSNSSLNNQNITYENHVIREDTVLNVEEPIIYSRAEISHAQVPRRLTHMTDDKELLINRFDRDENKYQRRKPSGGSSLNRWRIWATTNRPKQSWLKKKIYAVSAVVLLFVLFFLLLLLTRGDLSSDDILQNPNIKIQDS